MGIKLYVGNLSYTTSEDTLRDAFSKFSPSSVSIIEDKMSGRSRGFGFVEFESDSADDVINEMNGTDLDGRQIVVRVANEDSKPKAQPGNRLYIGNLSYDMDDGGLKDTFAQYGEVTEATVTRFKDTGKSKGFGFVAYNSVEDAQKALDALNGQEVMGRKMVVRFAIPKTQMN